MVSLPESSMANDDWSVSQWLQYLESMHPADIELGLDRVKRVAYQLDCYRVAPTMILVGGTNGKGTTCALLSAALSAQGLKTGSYNSPHILRYNERVSVNGQDISDSDLIRSFRRVELARHDAGEDGSPVPLTYFEFGTLAALAYFQEQSLDACVLEIGLGGRLDAVNVVESDLCIVTSIALDHQAWLGDTVEQIAYEKCAIAREGIPLVCGQPGSPEVAKQTVLAQGGIWFGRGDEFDMSIPEDGQVEVRFRSDLASGDVQTWKLPAGAMPIPNIATATQALALLGRLPEYETYQSLIQRVKVPGRQDKWIYSGSECGLSVTLDVAHNPQAAELLCATGREYQGIILAMLCDKDVESVVKSLPKSELLYLAGLDCYRGLDADSLGERVSQGGRAPDLVFASVNDALDHVQNSVSGTDQQSWLVMGSFFTVEAAMHYFQTTGKDVWKNI